MSWTKINFRKSTANFESTYKLWPYELQVITYNQKQLTCLSDEVTFGVGLGLYGENPVTLKQSEIKLPFISASNREFECNDGDTLTSSKITCPVRSNIISKPNSSKQFVWEAQFLCTCWTMCDSAAISVFSTTSKIEIYNYVWV